MTVSASPSKITYIGNHSVTAFAVPFQFYDPSHVRIVLTHNNLDTVLESNYRLDTHTNTVHYPISGMPLAPDQRLTVYRWLPLSQDTQLTNQGSYHPVVVETALDTAMMIAQQLQEQLLRTIRLPISYDTDNDGNTLAQDLINARDQAVVAASAAAASQTQCALLATQTSEHQRIVSEISLACALDASTAIHARYDAEEASATAHTHALTCTNTALEMQDLLAETRAISAGVADVAAFLQVMDYGEISPIPWNGPIFDFGEMKGSSDD